MNTELKLGFDFHGVINADPEAYKVLFDELLALGVEIHIVTGAKFGDLKDYLEKYKIRYTRFYSITDQLLELQVPYLTDSNGRPGFSEEVWNISKAIYCARQGIYEMYDDSEIYGKYFKTRYFQVIGNNLREEYEF